MKRRFAFLLVMFGWAAARPSTAQMPMTKVRVAEAKMLDAPATITLVGTVDANRRSNVSSEIAGIVMGMPVRQGDRVEAGGVLCKLNDDALALRLAEAKARLGGLSERHREWMAGTRTEELARLKALLDETTAEFEQWKFEKERIENLYAGSESNAKERTDTRAQFLAAEQRRAAAQAAFDMGVAGPRQQTIAQAAYEVAEQQAVVDRLESDLRKTTIRAPFTGYVLERATEVGEWVPGGGRIVQMVEIQTVLVRVDVPEAAFPHALVGAGARVQIDALKRSFPGAIKHVIRQGSERAHTFPVEVELDNHDGLLAGGMFARVTVPSGPKVPVIAVPKDSVIERAGVVHLATVIPGDQGGLAGALIPVTVGSDVNDWIAITSGNVKVGQRVITHGNEQMQPFPMPIQIVDEAGNPVVAAANALNDQRGSTGQDGKQ